MTIPLLVVLALTQSIVELKDARDAAREEQRRLEERKKLARVPDPIPHFKTPPTKEQRFYEVVPQFRKATEQYRQALGLEPDLSKSVKELEKLIDPLKDYFDSIKIKPEPMDLSEFKTLSPKELSWETLTTAERVDNDLQLAHRVAQASDREGTINIKTIEFFIKIQGDLIRLEWLTSKMGSRLIQPSRR